MGVYFRKRDGDWEFPLPVAFFPVGAVVWWYTSDWVAGVAVYGALVATMHSLIPYPGAPARAQEEG